jgi:hypothetical protein
LVKSASSWARMASHAPPQIVIKLSYQA